MIEKLSSDLISLLQEALGGSLGDYEVKIDGGNEGGAGYLGEMVFITLKNRMSLKISHLVVKQTLQPATQENKELFREIFYNEIYFYQKVITEFDRFQKNFPKTKPFDKIPTCLAFQNEEGKQKFVMINLKTEGFNTLPRTGDFDDMHTKLLMEVYGQFHGLSAAFREHNPREFNELTSRLKNPTKSVIIKFINEHIVPVITVVMQYVDDGKIKEKLEKFKDRGSELVLESLKYNGKNPIINHGDCWSNNVMFKYYSHGRVEDMRMCDFQLSRVGSVVCDLTYLLYSGVKKDILDNLDYYLKIYHDSFSNTLLTYDLDPAKIFTFEDLKEEFRQYYAFGFVMSQLAWPSKLSVSYEKRNLVEMTEGDQEENFINEFYQEAFAVNDIRENCLNVVKYLYKADIL